MEEVKMAEDSEDVEFVSLHKSIKNTSWSGKILTEPCRTWAEELGHLKGQERFLLSQVGQKNEGGKGRGKEAGWDLQNPGGTEERRGLHIQGSPSLRGTQLGQKERLILCGKRTLQPVCRTEWDLYTGCWAQPCPRSLRGCPPLHTRAGCWNVGIGEQTQAENCGWLWGDILRGQEGGRSSANGMLVEEAWTTREAEQRCWVMPKGKNPIAASLPLCLSLPLQILGMAPT